MPTNAILNMVALATLVPASVAALRGGTGRTLARALLALALAGALARAVTLVSAWWQPSLSAALWVTVAATLACYVVVGVLDERAWRLGPLLLPYVLVLGLLASIWTHVVPPEAGAAAQSGWFAVHIAVSVATYALATLAAVTGAAVLVQEHALRKRRPTPFTRRLPSVSEGESLEFRLLAASEAVLALGLLTGMAMDFVASGILFAWTHKTVFAWLAFLAIGALLIAHRAGGVRGRKAARLVLVGYLLLTLAYLGAKFVQEVLIG